MRRLARRLYSSSFPPRDSNGYGTHESFQPLSPKSSYGSSGSSMNGKQVDTLNGSVMKVIYRSADTGFSVIKIKLQAKKHVKRNAVVVGSSAAVIEGEYIEAVGVWEEDEKYGVRLRADNIRQVLPRSAENAAKYLQTFKGVGPKTAQKIVGAYPEEYIFDVMDSEPDRIASIPGVGRKLALSLVSQWESKKAAHEVTMFLHECGIGAALSDQILETYGRDAAVALVKSNPYALVRSSRGLTFQHADKIGARMGIALSDVNRLRCAVTHSVNSATFQNGHCCVPQSVATAAATRMLQGKYDLAEAVDAEVAACELVSEEREGVRWLYPRELHGAEVSVARDLQRISRGNHPLPWVKADRMVEWAESSAFMRLAPMQAEAVRRALTDKVLLVTGGPGVGKTHTIATVVRVFKHMRLPCVLASPTGRASARLAEFTGVKALTLHRLLDYDSETRSFKRNKLNPLHGSMFLIDEVSMMDVCLARSFLEAVPTDAVVILVGDVNQLPSVAPGNVLHEMIRSGRFATVKLTRIFRQHQHASNIVEEAHRLLHGQAPEMPEYPFNSASDTMESLTEYSDLRLVRADSQHDALNAIKALTKELSSKYAMSPRNDLQVLTPMRKGLLGSRHLNKVLQALVNPKRNRADRVLHYGAIEFRLKDKVMQVVNDRDKNVYNGEIGTISYIQSDGKKMSVTFAGENGEPKVVSYSREALTEIVPSYAITIHKSQGSEFPVVILPIMQAHSIMLERHLLYTGMTRSRKLTIIVSNKAALETATKRETAMLRHSFLMDRIKKLQ